MAVSPNELLQGMELSEKLKLIADPIEKKFDEDIRYGYNLAYIKNNYNNPSDVNLNLYIPKYDQRTRYNKIKGEDQLKIKVYICNLYKNKGWDIKDNTNSEEFNINIKFNLAHIRDNTIDELLDEDK